MKESSSNVEVAFNGLCKSLEAPGQANEAQIHVKKVRGEDRVIGAGENNGEQCYDYCQEGSWECQDCC